MTNEQAIASLERISQVLKAQCYELDKLAKAEMLPPHYVVQLGQIQNELLKYSRSLPLGKS
jgi:hypothetical protein